MLAIMGKQTHYLSIPYLFDHKYRYNNHKDWWFRKGDSNFAFVQSCF